MADSFWIYAAIIWFENQAIRSTRFQWTMCCINLVQLTYSHSPFKLQVLTQATIWCVSPLWFEITKIYFVQRDTLLQVQWTRPNKLSSNWLRHRILYTVFQYLWPCSCICWNHGGTRKRAAFWFCHAVNTSVWATTSIQAKPWITCLGL